MLLTPSYQDFNRTLGIFDNGEPGWLPCFFFILPFTATAQKGSGPDPGALL